VRTFAAILVVCAAVAGALTTAEGAGLVLFGWIGFLTRVVPNAAPDWPSVIVGVAAALLFVCGVHWAGRSWRTAWTPRSTLAVSCGVVLLFAAGVAVIGIVHQVGWLASSGRPLVGESLARRYDSNTNLKSIGIGLQNFHDQFLRYPAGGTFASNGEMMHSWETEILPFMWYSSGEIDRKRPWNDPVNARFFKCVIPEFINGGFRAPDLNDPDGYGLSHYAANSRVMAGNTGTNLADIKDGAANTILVGEVNARFRPWGHPANWRDPAIGVGRSPDGFGGPPGAGGARFLMADGSVRFVSDRTDPEVMRALATPNGGDGPTPINWAALQE
jgi:hypothetical protein